MVKKIKYNDAAYILGYKGKHFIGKYFCNWTLIKRDDNNIEIYGKIKMWLYILLFLPSCLFQIFYLMWDGGLKEFEIENRIYTSMNISKYCQSKIFERANEVLPH